MDSGTERWWGLGGSLGGSFSCVELPTNTCPHPFPIVLPRAPHTPAESKSGLSLRSATTRLSEAPWSGRGERTARFPAPALPVARDLHVAGLRLPLPSRPSITAFRSPQPEQSRLCPLGRGTLLTPPGRCGPPDSCWLLGASASGEAKIDKRPRRLPTRTPSQSL
ncbi:uncharacterized protein [Physeter macrocephalus]|uniref:Uncharacterized protein isoform X3 n=1 Tax=Physeter macrocephalus TaxID=9755 RepID=A0A455B136_PHYMC|nr:uncharacterized protein LOC114485429 isoform X3 [Physeter catodon]|eukprot:XP_028342625.1 uncharacterized protein LOC114485429 isoform X4 [Physeter catodon]